MPNAEWFPGARLNFVDQILRHVDRATPAIVYDGEAIGPGTLGWSELRQQVAAFAVCLQRCGVGLGDRVVAIVPNVPQTVVAFLAVASVGAVWSLCAPDMGVTSVIDRFQQIEPKVLIAVDGYRFGGKDYPRRDTLDSIVTALPTVTTLVWLPLLDRSALPPSSAATRRVIYWADAVAGQFALSPVQVEFSHPLWIVYSSGTTGVPKAIVHSHGGALAIGLVTMALHWDLKPGSRYFWYSSTGWIMWNLQVMGLLVGATICLYDGAVGGRGPQPDLLTLWRFVADHRVTLFGAGAAYFAACMKANLTPGESRDLSSLESVGSTGSPLASDCFRWIYKSVRADIWLFSVSGGTDIAGAFVNGTPTLPVRLGEIQCRNLGAAVHAFDDRGTPVVDAVGELVCTRPMPSMPVCFWNDPDAARYRESYFQMFGGDGTPSVWRHGDWILLRSRPEATAAIIYGRSDATINRHGIRMGTAEFYRIAESHPDIVDSVVVDLEYLGRPSYLGMFIALRPGVALTPALVTELRERIRRELSPKHVPDEILEVPSIPRTLTGKKLEVPLKKLLLGAPAAQVINPGALANPDSVVWFVRFAEARGKK
jgi:acetoacetyl-CoA synthetase